VFRVSHEPRAVEGVHVRHLQARFPEARERRIEHAQLQLRCVPPHGGGCQVRVEAVPGEGGYGDHAEHCVHLVEAHAETAHPRVYFQVRHWRLTGAASGLRQGKSPGLAVHRGCQVVLHQRVRVPRPAWVEDEDAVVWRSGPGADALLHCAYAEPLCFLRQGLRHEFQAMPVAVGLNHGHHVHVRTNKPPDLAVVVPDRFSAYFHPGSRMCHCFAKHAPTI
jgi:hypothetical protein